MSPSSPLPEGPRTVAAALSMLAVVLAVQLAMHGALAVRGYPFLSGHPDEFQCSREALLYLHGGHGRTLNRSYPSGFPLAQAALLARSPLARLPADRALAHFQSITPVWHVRGRFLSMVWGLVLTAAVWLACRTLSSSLAATAAAALVAASMTVAERACSALPDVQATALAAVSLAALFCWRVHRWRVALVLGALAMGAAGSTKYNTGPLVIPWIAVLAREPGGPRLLGRAVMLAGLTFLAISPQWLTEPIASLRGVLWESMHMRLGAPWVDAGATWIWPLANAISGREWLVPVGLCAAIAALFHRGAALSAALAFVAIYLLVGSFNSHSLHYLLPAFPFAAVCFAAALDSLAGLCAPAVPEAAVTGAAAPGAEVTGVADRASRTTRPLQSFPMPHDAGRWRAVGVMGAAWLAAGAALGWTWCAVRPWPAPGLTRLVVRGALARLPAGSRVLAAVPSWHAPGGFAHLTISSHHRERPYADHTLGSIAEVSSFHSAQELTALAPDAVVLSVDWISHLAASCARPGQEEARTDRQELAALAAFWPPPPGYREELRVRPDAGTIGPELVLLVRASTAAPDPGTPPPRGRDGASGAREGIATPEP